MKYIYCKDDKYLRCKVYYHASSNSIMLQLQIKKDYLLFRIWEFQGRELQMIFTEDNVEKLNKLHPYFTLCRDVKYYKNREDVLLSAINELFDSYIEDKNKKQSEQLKVKNIYSKL